MPDRSRRRILLVIAGLPAGGAERQMSLLAAQLDRTRYEPGLLIFNDASKIHYPQLFDLPLWFRALGIQGKPSPAKIYALLHGIAGAVRDFRPDLVHTSLNVANHAVRTSKLIYRWKAPVVTSVRNDFDLGYSAGEKLLERLLWRRSAYIVCNSDAARNQMSEALGIGEDRIATVRNGIDEVFFAAAPSAAPADWPPSPVALTAGRFTAQKNQTGLVDALAALERTGQLGEWSFVLLGEGPLGEALAAQIREAGLGKRVRIRPPARDMASLYRAADLLILPSRFEGLSNVCLEAAASAVPVLASPGANAQDLIAAGGGWPLAGDMTEDLEETLALSPAERRRAGERGRAFVRKHFSAERMTNDTSAIYERILARETCSP